ncbi:MAG TPA: hypothetical protein VLF89_10035 [Candidatus Saccharimonadales bacterium]|nr:hypothetical protein [Candidatus Saccharimonadales bacterium]
MKIQDIIFIITAIILVGIHKRYLLVSAGLLCLLFSIPLFAKWIFFTAERLTWYAAGFFLLAILLYIVGLKKR